MMNWQQTKANIQEAVSRLKSHKVLNNAVESALNEIPVVGSFLSKYWSSMEGSEDLKSEQVAEFLEKLAQQETLYERLYKHLDEQGDQLIELKMPLGKILDDVMAIREDVTVIRASVKQTNETLAHLLKTLEIKSAKDLLGTAESMVIDSQRRQSFLREIQHTLERAGEELEPKTYYLLGMMFAAMNEYKRAEASLLEATKGDDAVGDAYYGLAIVYQRRATEFIGEENFGLAEDALKKATKYAKLALPNDPTASKVQVQLGYIYKDLLVRYQRTGRAREAKDAFEMAKKNFDFALRVNSDDSSAHNGLANICLLMGDFDCAIEEGEKAIELDPRNLFAHYDLSQTYYYRATSSSETKERYSYLLKGLKEYIAVVKLDGDELGSDRLPSHAREHIRSLYEPLVERLKKNGNI